MKLNRALPQRCGISPQGVLDDLPLNLKITCSGEPATMQSRLTKQLMKIDFRGCSLKENKVNESPVKNGRDHSWPFLFLTAVACTSNYSKPKRFKNSSFLRAATSITEPSSSSTIPPRPRLYFFI